MATSAKQNVTRQKGSDKTIRLEQMSWEIKGSIYTLLSLFQLVSLTSYLPLDTLNIFHGRLDHINNLGGLVGAVVAEIFLGTSGIAGYSILAILLLLSFHAFNGIGVREDGIRVLGITLGTLLTAITCHLLFFDRVPEASLLQGGLIGKTIGFYLRQYFNTTGSLLVVGGGYLVTFILTVGLTPSRVLDYFSDSEDESEEEEKAEEHPTKKPIAAKTQPKEVNRKKSPKRKKQTEGDSSEENSVELEADGSGEDEGDENPALAIDPDEFQELIPVTAKYAMPSNRLLKTLSNGAKRLSRGEVKENGKKLVEHLLSFQITGEITAASLGPVLTTYEFKPSAGVKLSKIAALQDDLGIVMGTRELRIIAPIPGKTVVGIEVPRPLAEIISFKDIISEKTFFDKKLKIPIALGKATDGTCVFGDLTAMPHLLVAGATGSGKSVFINSLIMSFLYRMTPQELRLLLVDPKMLELTVFDGVPHLISNVITDNSIAFNGLMWAVKEMERRYSLMAETGSKNIDSYNSKKSGSDKIPYIVVVVDELADLMMSGGEAVEIAITRLAQKARAAGLHLVIATQRPSTDVVTGLIKANIPSRISFKVPSGIDSRTVLDAGGAEELIGRGDCLMVQPAVPMRRLHGCFVTEEDLKRAVKYTIDGKDHSKNYIHFSNKKPDSEE